MDDFRYPRTGPVLRVVVREDDQIPAAGKLGQVALVAACDRIGSRGVRGANEPRVVAGDPHDRCLGQVELEPTLPPGSVRERDVSECVVAELVPIAHEQADEIRMTGRLAPDDEERRVNVLATEGRRDLRRPPRIGPVVEGQRDPASGRRLRGDELRTARTQDRPGMDERRLPAQRLMRLCARAEGVRGDPFEEDRDSGDDEAEREQAPVRRNP